MKNGGNIIDFAARNVTRVALSLLFALHFFAQLPSAQLPLAQLFLAQHFFAQRNQTQIPPFLILNF